MKNIKWNSESRTSSNWIMVLVVGLLAMLTGCWETSDGERAGIITKFSHSGAVWQTWEGEMHYAGSNGTIVADSWMFSIDASRKRDENIKELVDKLTEAQRTGKRVKVTYRKEMMTADWRSGTDYFVQTVEFVDK